MEQFLTKKFGMGKRYAKLFAEAIRKFNTNELDEFDLVGRLSTITGWAFQESYASYEACNNAFWYLESIGFKVA